MSKVIIWVHCVWACKNRYPYLEQERKDQLFQHLKENAREQNILIDTLNGYNDHIHCLIKLGPKQNIASVVQLLKGESSRWSNENEIFEKRLIWARGYFAASVDFYNLSSVRKYIIGQERRHGLQREINMYLNLIQKDED
jgi:REP element-mobilizing transposase RayT